ncbi:MAG: DUF262 domain-containing protein [Planctomycetaceae bacterium]|nr:DUF262 domain-containing protein [Planctomycetaceae bacterium]MCA9085739.1 DUF262 domain-containing protein [Planctomycetaceae bacterium]
MPEQNDTQPALTRRPEARGFKIETLLEEAKSGRLRIPAFQRPLRWNSKKVVDLFDSINRGFPIGNLLLSKNLSEAGRVAFGPVSFTVAKQPSALWVVDGQQRLTALIASMLRSDAVPRRDYWAVWYDLESQTFEILNRREASPQWIPLNVVSDSVKQLKWIRAWPYAEDREDLVDRILELGRSIREYEVPAYIVEGANDQVLRLIFTRVNTGGAEMRESEIFEALYGHEGEQPIRAAVARLTDMGFGELDQELFLRCLRSTCGGSPPNSDPEQLPANSIERTESALRRAIRTIMAHAGIPKFRLLPYRLPIYILTVFYDQFPAENQRVDDLAARWIWRGTLSEAHLDSSDAKVDRLVRFIRSGTDPEMTMAQLIESIPGPDVHEHAESLRKQIDEPINLNSARCKVFLLMLYSANPRTNAGSRYEPPDLFSDDFDPGECTEQPDETQSEIHDSKFYQSLVPGNDKRGSDIVIRLAGMRPSGVITAAGYDLPSFLLSEECIQSLAAGDVANFRRQRSELLQDFAESFVLNNVGDSINVRPSISAIVNSDVPSPASEVTL